MLLHRESGPQDAEMHQPGGPAVQPHKGLPLLRERDPSQDRQLNDSQPAILPVRPNHHSCLEVHRDIRRVTDQHQQETRKAHLPSQEAQDQIQ